MHEVDKHTFHRGNQVNRDVLALMKHLVDVHLNSLDVHTLDVLYVNNAAAAFACAHKLMCQV